MDILLKLTIFLPLISGIINGIWCKKISNCKASLISIVAILLAAIYAFMIFVHCGINKHLIHITLFKWIKIAGLNVSWAIYADPLTALMMLLVTAVSAVVHIYSLGYMADDKNLAKFLSYLSLFTFCMLALVSADNFLQLFFGWEGVGVCSYLLIGYYYHKAEANNAAIKAFIVNRVGDFAFIIGIIMIFLYTGSLEFKHVFSAAKELSQMPLEFIGYNFSVLDVICLMLFLGCMGKSAQIGMHVWLPDAMEGPTPVSALIHAATMVTAGVFVVARCSFMFEYSPIILCFITIIGAITCLFAALIAITQTDIKKIIAYSTCSQLGYMFFACGVSAYEAGIFHLFTHGFFKALLFLSAGSVIHSCHEQDIFNIGGIWRKMPFTYANFWLGSLAIVGIFPFAGFYSKDLVLESAYVSGGVGNFAFILGLIAAILTAIYSLKIIILTFHGKTKLSTEQYNNVHESPLIMNIPLVVLIFGAMFIGMLGYYILHIPQHNGFFSNSIFNLHIARTMHHIAFIIQCLPLVAGMLGALIGIYIYAKNLHNNMAKKAGVIYRVIKNKFFFDEFFDRIFVTKICYLSKISNYFDKMVIDRFGPNGFAVITRLFSKGTSMLQTGYIYNYVFYIICSLVICITFFVIRYLQAVGVN